MIWYVSKGVFKSTLRGNTPAMGLAITYKKGEYAVVDDSRKTVLTLVQTTDVQVLVTEDTKQSTPAQMDLETTGPLTRPPRAVRLSLKLDSGRYVILQDSNHNFSLFFQGEEVGTITHMSGTKPQIFLPDTFGAVQAALVYTLALLMYPGDDAEFV